MIYLPSVLGRYSSGQRGQTVNLLVFTFAGSNPALPTNELKLKACTIIVQALFLYDENIKGFYRFD